MKKILVVINHLTVGGAQKSLITFLNNVDYSKCKVDLYLRRNRLDLLPYVNENVQVIINDDQTKYYRMPIAILYQGMIAIEKIFGGGRSTKARLEEYISRKMMERESRTYFLDTDYDVAISFTHGNTALFVADYINAKKKILRYSESVDTNHSLHQRIFQEFDNIVTVSDAIKSHFQELYLEYSEKFITIDNIVDEKYVKQASKEDSPLISSDNNILLCSVARFSYIKGIDLAVECARLLKEKGYQFIWYLIGDGSERERIQTLIEKYDLTDNVRLTGMITNPLMYVNAADIIVQPSREEASSNALIEAQILCKPVVVTKTACGLSLVKDGITGVQVDITAEAIRDGIEQLIKDKKLCASIEKNLSSINRQDDCDLYKSRWNNLLG